MANYNTDPITGKFMKSELTKKMQDCIYKLVYDEKKTNKQICEELDIAESTFYGWFHMEIFATALQKERDAKFKELSNKALKKLEKLLDSEDARTSIRAVEMVLSENCHLKGKMDINLNTSDKITVSLIDDTNE